ncbi:MAG: YheT family hydrolase [Bdellovibrionia bacterium]
MSKSNLPPLDVKALLPPFWARGGHQQTLWGHFLPSPKVSSRGETTLLPLNDGDKLLIEIFDRQSPVVVSLYHGLSGDTNADYMQRSALLCERLGFTCVLVNHRGAGPIKGLAKKPYHSGIAEDISSVLDFLKVRFPQAQQIAVGFSMSGNILLNLVSGNRGSTKPDAAISVNAPINLSRASQLLHHGFNKVYDKRFINILSEVFYAKQNMGLIDPQLRIPKNATIWDLDEIFTAPLCGFKDRTDYYENCSTYRHVHKISVPTYVLTAADDPFVSAIDYLENSWSPWAQVRIEKHGGHLGFISHRRDSPFGRRWLDQYLESALKQLSSRS